MHPLIEEIRINQHYAQHLQSELPTGDPQEDATPKIRKSVSYTQDYLKKLAMGLDYFQGVLPPNCRYIEKLTNGTLVVIEEPPAYRTISVNYPMSRELEILRADGKIQEWGIDEAYYMDNKNMPFRFTLAFPYVIHLLMFDRYDALRSGEVFLRTARLAGYQDYLLKMPMMNISSDGYICYGDQAGGKKGSLIQAIDNTIMVFWSATFNQDYTYNYSAYKDVAGVNTYIGWQALSQIDPMFIYDVQWLKMENNLIKEIERMKGHVDARSKTAIRYEELSKVFTQPADTGTEEQIRRGSRSKRTSRLYYDIAQGIYLNDRFFFHVGDPIKWGNHTAYVDSFIGFFESDNIRMIRLQLDSGKLVLARYNRKVKEYLLKTASELRYSTEGTLKNGSVIKPDDIIIMNADGRKTYRKVHFIRHARDGVTEARLGNSFYILENTEGEVMDVKAPKYQGIQISKDKKYVIINSTNSGPFHGGQEVTYDGMNVSPRGQLRMDFLSTDDEYGRGEGFSIDLENDVDRYGRTLRYKRLYEVEETRPLPGVFRVGRKVLCLRNSRGIKEGVTWATPEGIIYSPHYQTSYPTIQEFSDHCLSEDGTTFSLKSFDLDLEFKLGDKVVYADWDNPINMLITRTITAFTIDTNSASLNFVLSDKDGRLSQVEYVYSDSGSSSSRRSNCINIGRIRKITNHFGRVTAGTKIVANKGYISHFPKKDVNIIIGFITDTGGDDPLVLCSNCCTLWFSEMMENFKRITIKSKKWPQLAHAPIDITKIKAQPGDIVNGKSDYRSSGGWLVVRTPDQKTPKIASLNRYSSYSDIYTMDAYTRNHVNFDCIPNPRISPTNQDKMDIKPGWPNFHGLFIESKISPLNFLEDGRSLLHVSDSHS